MRRCFALARIGAGNVSPNPMVGAVLVYDGKILGEGWHQRWGEAHAEVNCLGAVSTENQSYIPYSTLFCNLEPCSHFGKTPPCADLIIQHKIPRVFVSNNDPNPMVAGKGLAKLRYAGIEVIEGVLEDEGTWLNRAFFTWINEGRPRIILKWAQTADGLLGEIDKRTAISGPAASRLVHRWRAESDAILVGRHTAVVDNPRLDPRNYYGKTPLRIVLDKHGKIPASHHLLDDSTETWVYGNASGSTPFSKTRFIHLTGNALIPCILDDLKKAGKATLLVEGGANVLHQFLESGYWDEIRVLSSKYRLGQGVMAPQIPGNRVILREQFNIGNDQVSIFTRSF